MHVGLSQMRLASWINKASTSDDNLILSMFVVIIYLILNSFKNIQINRTINPAGERLSLMGGYFRWQFANETSHILMTFVNCL